MKTLMSTTSLIVLAALVAFMSTPAGAEDEAPPAPAEERPAPAGPQDHTRDGPPKRPDLGRLLRVADADHDGTVSGEEWKAFRARLDERFGSLDADADGMLSDKELPRRPRGIRRGMRRGSQVRGPQAQGRHARGPQARAPHGQRARAHGSQGGMRRGPPQGRRHARGPQQDGRRGPHARGSHQGRGTRGACRRGPQQGPQRGPGMRGRAARGMDRRGAGPRGSHRGPDGQGPGMRGPRDGARRGPQGDPDLGAKLDRLSGALEKLLEQMAQRPPR